MSNPSHVSYVIQLIKTNQKINVETSFSITEGRVCHQFMQVLHSEGLKWSRDQVELTTELKCTFS